MDSVEPIKKLNIRSAYLADTWKEFRQNFEQYLMKTEALNKPERVKVAIFLNAVGPDSVKVYNSFNLSDVERNNLACLFMEFEKYCTAQQRNQLYDTYLFEKCKQTANDTFDSFVNNLKRMVKYCAYEDEDRILCDRIVFGVLDRTLQKNYFELEQLNLERAIEMGQAAEKERTNNLPFSIKPSPSKTQPPGQTLCKNCNFMHPWNGTCVAFGKICKYCNRPNHYSGACFKKQHDEASLLAELEARYGRP